MSIQWDQLEPGRFEDLTAVLLSVINPEVRRVDGAGGDEGIDVAFDTPEGLVIYELKSWTGRLSARSRWQQLERSARRAAGRHPLRWIVVCPINLTPAEKVKFDSLASKCDLDGTWRGRTWLDARMAEHPYVGRYFGSAHDEVIQLLGQVGNEQAALASGIPDASDRLQNLARQLDEIDPYHRWSLTIGEGRVVVSQRPRFLGANEESPAQIWTQISFPATPEGRADHDAFQRSIDHGDPVEVSDHYIDSVRFENIPSHVDRSTHGVKIIMGGDAEMDEPATLAVVDDGELDELSDATDTYAWLPIRFVQARAGEVTRRGTATDDSGSLTVTLTVEKDRGTSISLTFDPSGVMPAATAPVRALVQALGPGRALALRFDNKNLLVGPFTIPGSVDVLGDIAGWIESLDLLQQLSGKFFVTPEDLTAQDHQDIAEGVTLLLGSSVTEAWTNLAMRMPAAKILEEIDRLQGGGSIVSIGDMSMRVGPHSVPLGILCQTLVATTVQDADELRAAALAARPDEELDFLIVPREDSRRITAPWRGGDLPTDSGPNPEAEAA